MYTLRLVDCKEKEVKKEDKSVHVGGGRTPNQPVHIKDRVVTVDYTTTSVMLLSKRVVFAGECVLYFSITECILASIS